MKRILYSICIGSVALALTAEGATNNDEPNTRRGKARKAQTVQRGKAAAATPAVSHSRQMGGQRNVTNERFRQRTNATPRTTSNAVIRENSQRNNRVQTSRERSV